MISSRSFSAIPALAAGLALLSGCSPDTAAPTPAASPSATADGCGDVAAVVRKHLPGGNVSAVTVNGQCTNVTIDTGLGDDDTAAARKLCDSAGEVAYVGDTNAVTVRGKSGVELSTGIAGMKCLP